ncbi:HAMP domain-containing histidine kinase [Blautia wexlerae]|uniref:sensor histidine kinase n=1 Tax=Blautia wexlerae TaxID=418240 RepID=UPI00156FB2C0|nr:HAMP domain-containing sensor histidine kinase [Blautia wexlerae]NSD28563.1 HAMP domain-containing histidine kinase [Blautia wexlerae]NSF45948.1 HAMP domain-containing histidine kinase [Blautia wexlerae]NSF69921.1 HAMP domain-containing histidine kinase [Blautia wexlerae]
MKGKGYRSSSVKAIWIVIAHLAAVAAAVCAAMFVMIYQTGIRLDDRGKSYTESEAFEKQVSNRGSDILVSLAAQDDINYLKNAGSSAVIDLAEFEEKGNTRDSIRDLSLKNTSGLAYSVSDLLEWGKDWEANYYEGVYDEDSQVIRCESSDGTSHYFYRTDFKKMVADGTLKINYNTDFLEEDDFESKTESEKLDTVADELYYRYTSQSENIGNVTDTRTNTEYPGCFFVELSQLDEKFAPQGAENILDAVNKSTEWNGRLEDAYKELFTLLDCIRAIQSDEQFNDYETSLASVFHSVGDYTEGSTNLTYLFADKEKKTIYTNRKAYSSYSQLEQNLEKIFKEKAYAVVYPELSECVTNIPDADLQVWNHTIDQSFDTKDFVFAVSVDTKFSVADSMADEAENYETYSKLMFPMLAGAIFGSVLWLIGMVWLTVTAGRKPKDEEIHLNGFDRWYTEIAAGAVIGIWLAGTIISGTLIANSSLGYSHAVVTVIVTCLICGTYTMAWFLIGYLSLVRRIKAGTLWKNSLIRTVLKWIGKCSGKLSDFARAFSRNTAEKIKVLLVGGAFLFLQFLIIGCGFTGAGVFLIILLIVDAAAVIFIIRKADGLDLIMDGLKKISDGELQYKIKTDTLTGKQKVMAEYINNIGSGLDAAVENSLKKERMQTELITNVSHDLKTPLTSIINYVDLMKRENPTDPKIQEYLRILDEKSQRLKVLTEDVVEASKASTGNIKLEMNDIDFVEMVQQVIGEFEEKFQEKNLTMMVHFTDEPSIIYADGQRMWRVLENVFGNVVKYAMEGTRVYAEISNRNKKVTFSLKNISAQPLNISADELTERFIRGDVARNTEGSGLGLSIAKSLTELQGGEFKLYLDGDLFKVMITFAAKN